MLKPGVPEIIIQAIDAQNSRRRRRRQAVVYDSTNNINLPKPPKDITFPGRKRPPPPPPLQEEMFHGQHQTQYGSTNSQSRFSSAKQINTNASQKTKTASKAKSVGTSTTENTYAQSNNQKESGPVTKHNLVPSRVTIPASITSQTKPPTQAPVNVIPEAINEPKPTVKPSVPKVNAPSKSNVQPNDHSEAVHHEQNSSEYSPQQINGKANAKVTQEALNNQHDLAPLLQYAEHPTEIMNAEASIELSKLLDYAQREHEHANSHAHAHDHAHPHTHSDPQTPPSAAVQPEKVYKETPVKAKKTVSTKPTRQESTTSNTGTNADANGPPAEMEAKFTSMFDAWYQAKFGAAKTTKPPAVDAPKQGKGKNAREGKQPYKEAQKQSKPKPQNSAPPKKKKLNLFKQHSSEKGSANYQETKATSAPQGNDKNRTPGPKTNSVDKTALFQEFMTMFQDQLNTGETAASNPVKAPYVESKAIPTKKENGASIQTKATHGAAKPISATHVPSEMKVKPTKATPGAAKPIFATHVPSEIKASPTKATPGAAKPKSATHVPSEIKANPTKATPGASKETTSKSKPGSSKTTSITKAKFGPQKPGAYAITTTQQTPSNTEQTNVTNDPTLVKLVTMSHPENLSLPHEHVKVNPEPPAEVIGPSRNEVLAGMNDVALPIPYAERVPNGRPVKARTRRPKQPKATTTPRPVVDPELLADLNEARLARGEPALTANQVDVNGNLLPFYKRQMRIGRLPARPHPLHNHGGRPMQHQHQHPHQHQRQHQYQHQHQYQMPHQHSEQGFGFNSFPNMFYPQPTNNWQSMPYNPYPLPNNPVPVPHPSPVAPGPQQTRAEAPLQGPVNVTQAPSSAVAETAAAAATAVAEMPINANALIIFFNALSNMYRNQPQPPNGQRGPLYPQQQRNMPPINGMLGPNAYGQAGQSTGQSNGNGEAAIGEPNPHALEMHHQAIHMEAGNAMTPNLHRQVHRLLRQRQRGHHRNMYGSYIPIPVITPSPAAHYDPDLMADFLEAQQNRRAALLG